MMRGFYRLRGLGPVDSEGRSSSRLRRADYGIAQCRHFPGYKHQYFNFNNVEINENKALVK